MKKGLKYPIETLNRDEVEKLIAACNKGATGTRNRALIALLWRAGLRVSEALALRPVDVEADSIRVLHGKGDRSRVVGLDIVARALLDIWLIERKELKVTNGQPLFCTLGGKALKTAYVRALMKRLAAAAGIEKRVHPHGLRHTHAFELVSEGCTLDVISDTLGHSHIATTERYIRHVNPRRVIDVIAART